MKKLGILLKMKNQRNLKFCANLTFMYQEHKTLLEKYDAAKSAGFKGVEVAYPYLEKSTLEEIVAKKEEIGLEQVLLNVFPGDTGAGEAGFAGLPGREIDFKNSLELSLKYADALKCKRLHLMSGKLLGSENSKAVLETLEKNLRYALPELERRGIVGLIEPINNFTVPGYVLSDYDAALSLIKSINSPFIRLQLDIFHLQQIHGNITRRIENLLPYTGHIQIAQVPTRNEPHTSGEIDYGYVFDLLEKLEYKGWIGLEYTPLKETDSGLIDFLESYQCSL